MLVQIKVKNFKHVKVITSLIVVNKEREFPPAAETSFALVATDYKQLFANLSRVVATYRDHRKEPTEYSASCD